MYELRNFYLDENDSEKLIFEYLDNYLEKTADKFLPEDQIGRWKFDDLEKSLVSTLSLAPDFSSLAKDSLSFGAVMDFLNDFYQKEYLEKLGRLNEKKPELERQIAIQVLDACWKRHLQNVDSLRSNIGLRAYAQRNPINEFKRESFEMFDSMIESFKDDTVKILFNIKIQKMSQAEYEQQKSQRQNQGKNN